MNDGLGFAKFMPYPFEDRFRGRTIRVYAARPRGGPAVVVMHGSAGATSQFFRFAYRIADEGFSVYAPVFFGAPDVAPQALSIVANAFRISWSRQFALFASDRSSPVTAWVRALCRHLYAVDGARVGVIGLGINGGIALASLAEPAVALAVVAEQTLPIGVTPGLRRNLGLGAAEASTIAARLSAGAELLPLRFAGDVLSPKRRYANVRATFPAGVSGNTKLRPGRAFAHGVFTSGFDGRAGSSTADALDLVTTVLRRKLR